MGRTTTLATSVIHVLTQQGLWHNSVNDQGMTKRKEKITIKKIK